MSQTLIGSETLIGIEPRIAEVRRTQETPPLQTPERVSFRNLMLGLVAGIIFGFLLQKGGVAKFHVLIGQLLLVDFTVLKVMLSAVIAGMIGVHLLHSVRLVKLQLKPTQYGANSIGGLIFGVGFALAAYCPGTGAAALGQGNFDALAVVAGMLVGAYLFAEASGYIAKTVNTWGDCGELTVDRLLCTPRGATVFVTVLVLLFVLTVVELLPHVR